MSAVVTAAGRVFYIIDEGPISSVFLPPKWKLVAREAFSGVLLWERPITEWESHLRGFRSGPPEIGRRMVAAGDRVYVSLGYGEPVTALDASTGNGRGDVAVATTSSGLTGRLSLLLVDPADLSVRWKRENLGTRAFNSGKRFFSMAILDLDKDDEFVLGHFGNVLIVYELDGTCREVLTGPYSFADAAFDPVLHTLYLGSSVSGGDGIYTLRLDRPGWRQTFRSLKAVGRLAQIERNAATLEKQIAAFRTPAYQPAPREVTVLGRKPEDRDYRSLWFVRKLLWSQQYGKRDELWCRDIDGRCKYNMTADEIVARAREQEASGRRFLVWSGHGHALYFPLTTFRRIVEAAPRALWGFEFAEMEGVDSKLTK